MSISLTSTAATAAKAYELLLVAAPAALASGNVEQEGGRGGKEGEGEYMECTARQCRTANANSTSC